MKHYFNIEATHIVMYDDDEERWYLDGAHEGSMSRDLASQIFTGLSRCLLTEEDALDILQRTNAARPK